MGILKFLIFIFLISINLNAQQPVQGYTAESSSLFVLPEINCSTEDTTECYKKTLIKLAEDCNTIEHHFDCTNYKAYPKIALESIPATLSRSKAIAINYANRLTKKENVINPKTRKTNIHLAGKYTDYVYLRIHGVWRFGVLNQSEIFKTIARSEKPINVIEMILPGHGKDLKKAPSIKYDDWIYAVDQAMKLAKNLGKKVIIESHSMGGLLASIANINWPHQVAGNFSTAPAYGVSHYSNFASSLPRFLKGEILGLDGLNSNLGRQTITLKNLVWTLYQNNEQLPKTPWVIYSTPQDNVVTHFDAYVFSLLLNEKGADVYFKNIDTSKDGILSHVSKNVMFGDKPEYKAKSFKRNYAQELLARIFNFCEPISYLNQTCIYGDKIN